MQTTINDISLMCDDCHTGMHSRPADIKELDVNKQSLFIMFRIQEAHILECPCCKKMLWQLGGK